MNNKIVGFTGFDESSLKKSYNIITNVGKHSIFIGGPGVNAKNGTEVKPGESVPMGDNTHVVTKKGQKTEVSFYEQE